MKKTPSIIIVLILAIAGVFAYVNRASFWTASRSTPAIADTRALALDARPDDIAAVSRYQYTRTYQNAMYHFSFKYPEDFSVSVIPADADRGNVILVQNIAKHIGMQILVTPFGGADMDMTAGVVQASIPGIKIEDAQPVLIGNDRTGLAFKSDNPAFGGSSREVWFVFRGNLYQISTYAELDPLMKGVFSTWQFQ